MPTKSQILRPVRYKTSVPNRSWVVQEDPPEFGKPRRPSKPMVLILDEQIGNTYALTRSLKTGGYSVQAFTDDAPLITKVRSALRRHFLLLTARGADDPLRALKIVQSLRRGGYDWPIVYSLKEEVSSKTLASYQDASVNGVLSTPARFHSPIHKTIEWIGEQIDLSGSGLTILEY